MGIKKLRKKLRKSKQLDQNRSVPPIDPRAMEKTMSDITRLLNSREFDSIDEMNAFLREVTAKGEIPSPENLTPLEQAQEIMYEAWNSSGKKQIELAHRALEICADCADAYVLLAEEAAGNADFAQAKSLYEQGVKAGERALGQEFFEENAGHFWGLMETRPYMRARQGLADCLWALGQQREAMSHYKEMLRLNPGDNQGIRYILADCLLIEGELDELEKLFEEYKEDAAAAWGYNRALARFSREGASEKAKSLLKEALKQNPYVPLYLTGSKKMPKRLPDYRGFGDENEAIEYVAGAWKAWQDAPDAIEWLVRTLLDNKKRK